MPEPEHLRRNEARKATRAYLGQRDRLALDAGAISRGLRYQGAFTEDEVNSALLFLEGLKHVKRMPDSDGGGAVYWQIDSPGLVAFESGQ